MIRQERKREEAEKLLAKQVILNVLIFGMLIRRSVLYIKIIFL
jgi:hypothetical protein